MGDTQKPEYTGMDKYPGWIATVITIVIGAIFLGALSTNFHHDDHGDAHGSEAHGSEAHGSEAAH